MLRRERKHFERKSRRFEYSNNEDRRQAVINFFGADPDMVDVSTVDGFSGPVTEVTFNGNVYWVLTDSEAEREATLLLKMEGSSLFTMSYAPSVSSMLCLYA